MCAPAGVIGLRRSIWEDPTARNYGQPNCVKDLHCSPCALLFAAAREALMKMARPDVETLAAVIGHSQIVVAAPRQLPADFDEVDIAILDWIIAESRLVGRSYCLPM